MRERYKLREIQMDVQTIIFSHGNRSIGFSSLHFCLVSAQLHGNFSPVRRDPDQRIWMSFRESRPREERLFFHTSEWEIRHFRLLRAIRRNAAAATEEREWRGCGSARGRREIRRRQAVVDNATIVITNCQSREIDRERDRQGIISGRGKARLIARRNGRIIDPSREDKSVMSWW